MDDKTGELLQAAGNGDLDKLVELIDEGLEINSSNQVGDSYWDYPIDERCLVWL